MRLRCTDRSRRSAGAWLGGGRHRFVGRSIAFYTSRLGLREATTRMPEHQPGEPASATDLYLEVNVFDTRERLVTCQRSSALFLAFLLANDGLCLLPGTLARVPPGGHRLPKDSIPVP